MPGDLAATSILASSSLQLTEVTVQRQNWAGNIEGSASHLSKPPHNQGFETISPDQFGMGGQSLSSVIAAVQVATKFRAADAAAAAAPMARSSKSHVEKMSPEQYIRYGAHLEHLPSVPVRKPLNGAYQHVCSKMFEASLRISSRVSQERTDRRLSPTGKAGGPGRDRSRQAREAREARGSGEGQGLWHRFETRAQAAQAAQAQAFCEGFKGHRAQPRLQNRKRLTPEPTSRQSRQQAIPCHRI